MPAFAEKHLARAIAVVAFIGRHQQTAQKDIHYLRQERPSYETEFDMETQLSGSRLSFKLDTSDTLMAEAQLTTNSAYVSITGMSNLFQVSWTEDSFQANSISVLGISYARGEVATKSLQADEIRISSGLQNTYQFKLR